MKYSPYLSGPLLEPIRARPCGTGVAMQIRNSVRIITFVITCALVANAQETRGTVIGRVVDASGAVVPKANVIATNVETGVKQTTATNSDGAYEFLYMLPGSYTVSASANGFKT